MSLPTPFLSQLYSEESDLSITNFTDSSHDTIEVGYKTNSKIVRHLSADQFNFETAVDNNIQEAYQSITSYSNPNNQSYSAKKPQESAYIVQLTATESASIEDNWSQMLSAIDAIDEIYSEFNVSIEYIIRSRLDTVILVSSPINVEESQLRDNLYGSFDSYLNPVKSGLLEQESDYELQLGETEFNLVNRKTIIPKLYTTILDETLSKLEEIKSYDRTKREDVFVNYSGIGPSKASKLADLVETYPENPFASTANNTLTKFVTAYANSYISENWPISSDTVSVTPVSPFTLIPINNTLSGDGISVTYYTDSTDIPYWGDELKNNQLLTYIKDEMDIQANEDEFNREYLQYISQL